MVDNAVIFGADRETAEKELKESLEFEMKLANVMFKIHCFQLNLSSMFSILDFVTK